MSWLWGNETTEQAQIVVSALQSELDEREQKIKALEAALRREQHEWSQLVTTELKELEARRARLHAELQDVDALIAEKRTLLAAPDGKPKAKKAAKKKKKANDAQPQAVTTPLPASAAGEVAREAPASATKADDPSCDDKPEAAKPLPMGAELMKVASVEPNVAFIIQRSTNSNTVVYAAQLAPNASRRTLDDSKPLDVYWIMYEKPDAPREELNMIERNSAYGVTVAPSTKAKGQYIATLASLKDRVCTLLIDEHGRVQARTRINGREGMVLRRVYVQMTSSWGIPTVDYVEIFGIDPETFASVYEKKGNK
ncbi:hypothetical protein P43SY_001259 [Pythium insidiosum]|uniref:DUF4833 domain-containing protein n=1 Tax=Pythium insidiosum TaxID=114742 RepID=A0AAD5Q7N6_PYTIN|nr:hypothetical protein P43SY_001259 [Pythium insidiosum]